MKTNQTILMNVKKYYKILKYNVKRHQKVVSKQTTIEKEGLRLSKNINHNYQNQVFTPDRIYNQEICIHNDINYYGSIGANMGSSFTRKDTLQELRSVIDLWIWLSTYNNGSEIILYEELYYNSH